MYHAFRKFSKHWQLIPDGDLWSLFHALLMNRPPSSFNISKVKGHATDEDINKGKCTHEDREGNYAADDVATSTWIQHNNYTTKFHDYTRRRHQQYTKFFSTWLTFLADLLQHDNTIREQRDKIADTIDPHRHHIIPTLPPYPTTGRPLNFNFQTISPRKGIRAQTYNDIFRFLRTLSVSPLTDNHNIGVSWLELFFLFLIRGGGSDLLDIQLQDPPPPIKFKRLLSIFQCVTRDLARSVLHNDGRMDAF